MNDIAIQANDIAFAYGERSVLGGVSFSIPRGEIWALVGRSGVGKTTLLQIIAGLFRPTKGDVYVGGRDNLNPGRIRGIVFQEDALLGWLTVIENTLFPNHKNPSAERRKAGLEALKSVGLAQRSSSYPNQLSAGMRKRLEFARALLADDEYILADEPFGTVDALTRRELWHLWGQLRERQPRTGILCTHDPEEAVRLCDAVVVLQRGEPANAADPLRIPTELRLVPVDHEDSRISGLKEQILTSLNGGYGEPS